MKKGGYIVLLAFVLLILAFNFYFVFNVPCEPITRCIILLTNISCASNNDCFSSSYHGVCNTNTFKCTNLILNTDELGCLDASGQWYEENCGWRKK